MTKETMLVLIKLAPGTSSRFIDTNSVQLYRFVVTLYIREIPTASLL